VRHLGFARQQRLTSTMERVVVVAEGRLSPIVLSMPGNSRRPFGPGMSRFRDWRFGRSPGRSPGRSFGPFGCDRRSVGGRHAQIGIARCCRHQRDSRDQHELAHLKSPFFAARGEPFVLGLCKHHRRFGRGALFPGLQAGFRSRRGGIRHLARIRTLLLLIAVKREVCHSSMII